VQAVLCSPSSMNITHIDTVTCSVNSALKLIDGQQCERERELEVRFGRVVRGCVKLGGLLW